MSKASEAFDRAIQDAHDLLNLIDNENKSQAGHNTDALKRAGLILALAAWETYIKDRIVEEFKMLLSSTKGSQLSRFVERQLENDLKRFFNPNSGKVRQLFESYFEVDITESWKWNNYDAQTARTKLNELISKRGDAAHQANTSSNPDCAPHLVKRDELDKAIRFLKGLVEATDTVQVIK